MSILLVILAAWLAISLLIVVLLIAARRDDEALDRHAPAPERCEDAEDDVASGVESGRRRR